MSICTSTCNMLKNYYYFTPFLCTILALSWLLPFFTDAGVFSNAGLEVYLLRLVRCLFPYYFGFSFISPASDNSPNISLSYACCFLGHCQWHGHVLIRFSMTLFVVSPTAPGWSLLPLQSCKVGNPEAVTRFYMFSPFPSFYVKIYCLCLTCFCGVQCFPRLCNTGSRFAVFTWQTHPI